MPYCKIETVETFPNTAWPSGDIVFARNRRDDGQELPVVDDPPDAVFASYLNPAAGCSTKKLLPEFVSFFFQTAGYWQSIKDGSSGSAQGGFNATKLHAPRIP